MISYTIMDVVAVLVGTLTPESVPPLQLSLGNNSADTVCGTSVKLLDLKAISQNKTTLINGFIQLSALFQNQFQSCIPALSNVTSIDFSQYSTATDSPISFCLANMQLLPTKVLPPGMFSVSCSELCSPGALLSHLTG